MFNGFLIVIGFFFFFWGVTSILVNRANLLLILMSLELILLSVNFNLVLFSINLDDFFGQIFSLFILTIAAAESSIGLALLVVFFRLCGSILLDMLHILKA